jgi:hypothetical protein
MHHELVKIYQEAKDYDYHKSMVYVVLKENDGYEPHPIMFYGDIIVLCDNYR